MVIGCLTLSLIREKTPLHQQKKPTCGKCRERHYSDFLNGTGNCFASRKSEHKFRDFPNVRGQDKGSCQAQASGSNEARNKNRLCAINAREKQETSSDVVTGMLKFFFIDV